MSTEQGWPPHDRSVVDVAARRAGRGRGTPRFGNAGVVRNLLEAAYRRVLKRDPTAKTLTIVDIIGPPPDRQHVLDLGLALDELDRMTGLSCVKKRVNTLVDLAATNYARELKGEAIFPVPLNRVFLGNPGTGKTTVAKLYGRILKATGYLTDGKCELKQPSDFIGAHVGETPKRTTSILEGCVGKVLIIDEAYSLNLSNYGHEAIDTFVGIVHGHPGENIAVVMIGYEKQMRKMFREMNPGLSSRFNLQNAFQFDDFLDDELESILQRYVLDSKLHVNRLVRKAAVQALGIQRSRPNFGNARTAVAMIAQASARLATRDSDATELTLADFGLDRVAGDGLSALNGLFKVDHIKDELTKLKAILKQSERDGKDGAEHLKNYVFLGNPGTGKTTIARAMAHMLHEIGILAQDSIVICNGQDLTGDFVGQTSTKVNDIMAEAQGGVLFIDEAYTLGNGHYAQEAIDQLVDLMTKPEHEFKTVIILAGYTREMEQMLACNSGLISRMKGRIEFPDWDVQDCLRMVQNTTAQQGIPLEEAAVALLAQELDEIRGRQGWANARDCHTTMRELYAARALRLTSEAEHAPSFTDTDAKQAMETLRAQRPLGDAPGIKDARAQGTTHVARFQDAPAPAQESHNEATHGVTGGELQQELEKMALEGVGDGRTVFAALLEACKNAGYDASHDKRKALVSILLKVQDGANFPDDIIQPVLKKTNLNETTAMELLRPQVGTVLSSMQAAVKEEEARLEAIKRLEREKRLEEARKKEQEHRKMQENLRRCGRCPAGFDWHPENGGWRCNGGSHWVSNAQLPNL